MSVDLPETCPCWKSGGPYCATCEAEVAYLPPLALLMLKARRAQLRRVHVQIPLRGVR